MTDALGLFSFPPTPDEDAGGQKWPNADPKEFAGHQLANDMVRL
jgi:hypothetical protein